MQRTKSKILSILLSLVMLLSLLPTTALATDTYPTASEVLVDGNKYFGEPGCYYFKNGASACSKDPNNYNAYYNPNTGVLTLDGYNGGSIVAGGTKSKITVELVGNNSINGSLTSAWGGDITVTSSSGGTLSITNTLNDSNAAIGIETGYGPQTTGNVTITGNAQVKIDMTHNGTRGYEKAYGIFAKENITISENASVDITCATPNNTTGGDNCNGLRAVKDVIIDTTGTIKIDVTNAGGDSGYSFGIYPSSDATLNNVGNMEVKWKKHATHSSYPGGAIYGDKSFDTSTYAVNVDETETTCTATYTPKGTAITGDLPVAITKPVKGGTPQSAIAAATQYTGTIAWEGNPTTFAADTAYTANVTLTAKDGYQFADGVNPSVTDATISEKSVSADGKTLTFKATFSETDSKTLKDIDIITNPALTLAVPTAAPNATATNERSLAVTGVYDDGTGGPVAVNWKITTDPIPTGVSLDGSTLKVTNEAKAGTFMIKATSAEGYTDTEQVTITKDGSKETAIVAKAPATGTDIIIPNGGTNTSGNCSYKVYDQYGAAMTGISATWKMKLDPATVTGVTLTTDGAIAVTNAATTCTATVYAESGGVKSNEITFNIAREASVATTLTIEGSIDSVNVPTVTEPGTTECAYASYTATVKDQYGEAMTGQTIAWSVTENPGVAINNGQLTVTNKATAGNVTITAKCGTLTETKTVTINKDAAKVSIVKITAQGGATPVTTIICTGSQRLEYYTATAYDQYGVEKQDDVTWSLDPATVSGVSYEADATNGNIVTLKVAPNAAEGTFKLVATSQTVTTVKGELEIKVQKKNDVSSKINFNDGSLTYNGAGQKYEKAALDSSVTPGTGVKWTYTYAVKSGATGALDEAGLPKIVGTYTVTATYEDSLNIGSKSVTLNIEPKTVDIPAADTTVYTYDGTAKTYQIPASADYTVNHATQTNANETGYTVTVALTDENNTIWSDGNTIVKHYTFKIMKATPTGTPKYTAITTSGKTLEDANLTKGTITPDGTIKWNDAKTTVVEANKSYGWTFTPTDTANYKTLTGSIELWHKSTSSGGGSYYAPVVPDMPMVYWGCTGDAVKTLQEKLNAKGFNSGNVDGIFGAKTYAAVTAFQKANSLGVDGIVGKLTWAKLYDATPVNVTPVTTQPMLRTGSRGDAVRKLQELLNAKGYTCGSVDGIFGSKTYAAVLAFQKANGLGADGIVGPLTWAKLG